MIESDLFSKALTALLDVGSSLFERACVFEVVLSVFAAHVFL